MTREETVAVRQLQRDMVDIKLELARNTEITEHVRNLLTSLRVLMTISKWIAAISAAVAGLIALWKTGANPG